MGTSIGMIDRHYGHLARDGREHAILLLDAFSTENAADVHRVDARWTPKHSVVGQRGNYEQPLSRQNGKPSSGLEPETPSLPWRCSTN
jgi:hypothetical protein